MSSSKSIRYGLGRKIAVGIYARKLRCGCTLETWRHSQHRNPPCEFHAKAEADLAAHEWLHLSRSRRVLRTTVSVVALFGPIVVPICALFWVFSESLVLATLPLVTVPFVWQFAWRLQRNPRVPRHVAEFTGAVEPGDYGPNDVELLGTNYVPRAHSSCALPS